MNHALWTIAKHVALCCTVAASSRRSDASGVSDAQARRLRALGPTEPDLDSQRALARWYGLADGEPLPRTSRTPSSRPAPRHFVHAFEA